MSTVKKERWTEAEVLALPPGEHDYFDRKSGALLADPNFRKDMAKAISAFANSGGGHLVLGVQDNGTFDGVPEIHKGRTKTRDWLEQIIPELVSYPLEDFRVHEVEPATPSAIPSGQVLIVIDVGDSVLAPHQSLSAKAYYYRAGGRSELAPHFYLETLRNRLVGPSLSAKFIGIDLVTAYRHEGGLFVEAKLNFEITNLGRVAAYKWALTVESLHGDLGDERGEDYRFGYRNFPSKSRDSGIRIDDTILPSLFMPEQRDFGLFLHPTSFDKPGILADLKVLIPSNFTIKYRAVSEISRGELIDAELAPLLNYPEWADNILAMIQLGT